MGWNSYNVYGEGIDQDKAMHAANAMVKFHLNDHGWTYINFDDGWQGIRDTKTLALQPEPQRFKDMKAYIDELHALGLKAGLYSSPWVKTYGGRMGGSSQNADGTRDSTWNKNAPHTQKKFPFAIGKYTFTTQDAQQFAAWGADYLKYDWGPIESPETKQMHDAMRYAPRHCIQPAE
jgi:alpha-galactosidase